ncbi:MAG: LD-carboxypeptidase [Saprospiraceae bacterium]|nr:LD-carboxypeptidase [Saprospiraceae bacterium]
MKRRDFNRFAMALGMQPISSWSKSESLIKPAKLKEGDNVGLVAPGSPVPKEKIQQALETVQRLNLNPILGAHANKALGYIAGTDSERTADLHTMFKRPDIDAIWCLRGGYGCTRLLPLLDYDLIRRNPKLLIGYSDVTALHMALLEKSQLVSIHGPVATSKPTDYTLSILKKIIFNTDPVTIRNASKNRALAHTKPYFKSYQIFPGTAEGPLVGGNLSLMAALAGTPWSPIYKDKLVFIEDIGEKPYRIDRMLVQLFQATDLHQAAGIILGIFNDCQPDPEDKSLSLAETLEGHFRALRVPACYGFSFGHIDHQCTLPQGIRAKFNADRLSLTLLESAVF